MEFSGKAALYPLCPMFCGSGPLPDPGAGAMARVKNPTSSGARLSDLHAVG